MNSQREMVDIIAVLGYELTRNFELKDIARYRVEKAISLFNKKEAPRIVFCGSHSFWNEDNPKRTEARAMAEYAISLGLPKTNALLEEHSKDSVGNAYFLRKNYLDRKGWKSLIVVTSDFHVPKTKYVFKKVLGEGYSYKVVSAQSGLSEHELAVLTKREHKVIGWFKHHFKDVFDGDMNAIKNYLYNHHPGYSKNPEVTKEDIRKSLPPVEF